MTITDEFWDFIEQNVPNYYNREDVLRQADLQVFIDDGDDTCVKGITREEAVVERDRILFRLYAEAIDAFTRREHQKVSVLPTTEDELYAYCETVADIAYDAGYARLRIENNSRVRIHKIIEWSQEFNRQHQNTDWDEEDYLLAVSQFTNQKISQYQKPLYGACCSCGHHSLVQESVDGPDAYYSVTCHECGYQIEGNKAKKMIEENNKD